MALSQGFQVAKEKYEAQARQSLLLEAIQKTHALRADLHKAIASQQSLESMLGRQQAVHRQEVEHAKYSFATQDLEQGKLTIALQGYSAMTKVFGNITYTAALLIGFTSGNFATANDMHVHMRLRYAFMIICLTAFTLFTYVIYVSMLANVDGTKLAYQGTKGISDVTRAFHGLMSMRSEIFWSYVCGCVGYTLMMNADIFVMTAEDHAVAQGATDRAASGVYLKDEQWFYLAFLTTIAWAFFVTRMVLCFFSIRRTFRLEYDWSGDPALDGAASVAHHLDLSDDFSVELGPQSLRHTQHGRRASASSTPRGSSDPRSSLSPRASADSLVPLAPQLSRGSADPAWTQRRASADSAVPPPPPGLPPRRPSADSGLPPRRASGDSGPATQASSEAAMGAPFGRRVSTDPGPPPSRRPSLQSQSSLPPRPPAGGPAAAWRAQPRRMSAGSLPSPRPPSPPPSPRPTPPPSPPPSEGRWSEPPSDSRHSSSTATGDSPVRR
eukprot:TRINITY_DN334_c0_g5_i1.p1 TRINITY_DN334_c0_g5~~TRINITY_DN334_c0_g5_i1.p1  ORF type:complete len:497 (+),score=77.21 TRINITY_DN334_c0_g5_i1:76-1566(+)